MARLSGSQRRGNSSLGAHSTRKGKVWERAVVNLLKKWGLVADRTPAVLESMGGATGVDVRAMTRLGHRRLAVQCKVGACPNVWGAVRECEGSAHTRESAVAFVHRNHSKDRPAQTLVAMSPETFKQLLVGE